MKYVVSYQTGLYAPAYKSYVANCVYREPGLNGTFLAQTLFDASFNYAVSGGNAALQNGVGAVNQKVGSIYFMLIEGFALIKLIYVMQASKLCGAGYGSSSSSYVSAVNNVSDFNHSIQVCDVA